MNPKVERRYFFVCTGNTCRSPMARFLAARMARDARLPWSFGSAGLSATAGASLSTGAARALAKRGIVDVKHAARPVAEADLAEADVIFALAREHRDALAERFPAHANKIRLLRSAAGLPGDDVSDPLGLDDAAYDACASAIAEALEIIFRREKDASNSR
jgi:protein-tyrosine-phosphatase